MLVLSLVSLAIATVTTCLSLNSQEEVFKVAMGFTALLFTVLTLFFVPWELKLLVILVPLILERLANQSAERMNR